jgi:hypothetical protein
MAEDLIKLFATRAERYPEQTDTDLAQGAARAALSAIPVIGGAITEVLSMVLAPAVVRRRDQWFKELADALDEIERKVEGFRVENLQNNESFVSAVIQATRAAAGTRQQEKLTALRNAVLNTALSNSLDEDKQSVFLNLIEVLSATHLLLLHLFNDRSAFSHERRVQIIQRRALTDPMIIELTSRGLLNDPRPYVARNRDSGESLSIQEWTLTALGKEFLSFVATPEPLK